MTAALLIKILKLRTFVCAIPVAAIYKLTTGELVFSKKPCKKADI